MESDVESAGMIIFIGAMAALAAMRAFRWAMPRLGRHREAAKRRRTVARNRARYPDLLKREEWGEDPVVTAILMQSRAIGEADAQGIGPEDPSWPRLGDYYDDEPMRGLRRQLSRIRTFDDSNDLA